MVEAARKYDRVVQHGTQSRSRPPTKRFVEFVQSGKIGDLLMAKVWNAQMRRNIGRKSDEPVPSGINYDIWSGPAPVLPFNRNHFHSTYNWHWHYGAGDLGNDSVHWLDVARWALNVGYPNKVSGMGRKLYFDDDQQTPDTQNVTYNYKDKVLMYEQRLWNRYKMDGSENGITVYGTDGMVQHGRWRGRQFGFRVFDQLILFQRPFLGVSGRCHDTNQSDCQQDLSHGPFLFFYSLFDGVSMPFVRNVPRSGFSIGPWSNTSFTV